MTFNSAVFLFCFLPSALLLYRLGSSEKYKNILLCILSLVFYAFGQIKYVPLFLLSVAINYTAGLILKNKKSSGILAFAVFLNVAILCTFKYLPEMGVSGIELPIGISFFTFQGLSYVIDTYRDKNYGTSDFMKVFLYISFFPRLIAGPIVKYHEIEDQLTCRECTDEKTSRGICRFIFGMAKKLLISENCAKIANTVFDNGTGDFRLAWLGAAAYMLELYYDFSAYSDMAIGTGMMFGFIFPENFDHPYSSASIKEFWRKWHISLSSWFKEYVYIPLGGNRKGKTRAAINRMIVFLLTGIWHGGRLTYVVWGLGHGLLSSAEDFGIIPVKKLEKSKAGKILLHVYTLLAVCLLFVVFRASSLGDAFKLISVMFTGNTCEGYTIASLLTPAAVAALIASIVFAPKKYEIPEKASYIISIPLLILCIMAMAKGNFSPFIYMQF